MISGKYAIIVKPVDTEKSNTEKEERRKVTFKVHPHANKVEIKRAVEELFNVKVEKVSTINVLGKFRRLGRNIGKRSDWKKAIVTLKEGQSTEFLEM